MAIEKENVLKTLNVLNDFGFQSLNLKENDFFKIGNIIQLGYPPLRIDLLNDIDGVTFLECFENMNKIKIDGLIVNFISYDDLVLNKKSSGRHKDLDDIENMKKN